MITTRRVSHHERLLRISECKMVSSKTWSYRAGRPGDFDSAAQSEAEFGSAQGDPENGSLRVKAIGQNDGKLTRTFRQYDQWR
jgi:hypothetical protein